MGKNNVGIVNIGRSEIILKTGEVIKVTIPEKTVREMFYRRIQSLELFPSSFPLDQCDAILTELYFPTVRGERVISVQQIEKIRSAEPEPLDKEVDYSMLKSNEDHILVPD